MGLIVWATGVLHWTIHFDFAKLSEFTDWEFIRYILTGSLAETAPMKKESRVIVDH